METTLAFSGGETSPPPSLGVGGLETGAVPGIQVFAPTLFGGTPPRPLHVASSGLLNAP